MTDRREQIGVCLCYYDSSQLKDLRQSLFTSVKTAERNTIILFEDYE